MKKYTNCINCQKILSNYHSDQFWKFCPKCEIIHFLYENNDVISYIIHYNKTTYEIYSDLIKNITIIREFVDYQKDDLFDILELNFLIPNLNKNNAQQKLINILNFS